MSPDSLYSAIALSVASSPARFNLWHDLDAVAPEDLVERCTKLGLKTQAFLTEQYPKDIMECAKRIYEKAQQKSIRIVHYWDDSYPSLLKEIDKPPLVLYVLGEVSCSEKIAVVGTRKTDIKSRTITQTLCRDLAVMGFTIVSGMAIGVDRDAHEAALDCCGATIGVLANGIDVIYPWANRDIYEKIQGADQSCLISEYPPHIRAGKWTFARRNRIISGLSRATVVIKAAEQSGALITANYALEQNRDLFVCSGHAIDREYQGCHNLLKSGAYLVTETSDILHGLHGQIIPVEQKKDTCPGRDGRTSCTINEELGGDDLAVEILSLLDDSNFDIDSLIRKCNRSISEVSGALLELELAGHVFRDGNTIIKI